MIDMPRDVTDQSKVRCAIYGTKKDEIYCPPAMVIVGYIMSSLQMVYPSHKILTQRADHLVVTGRAY